MVSGLWIFLTLACVLNGMPLSDPTIEDQEKGLEEYIKTSLENLRGEMSKGIPSADIPPLEPLVLTDLKFNFDNQHVDMKLEMDEVRVSGLSGFVAEEVKADLSEFRFKVLFRFPRLTVTGRYDVDGKIVKIIPIYGNGAYNITATHAIIGGSTQILLSEDAIDITPLDLHLQWEDIHLKLENFLGGGSMSDVLQQSFPLLAKRVFESFRPQILKELSRFLTLEITKILHSDKVVAMIQDLLSKSMNGDLP